MATDAFRRASDGPATWRKLFCQLLHHVTDLKLGSNPCARFAADLMLTITEHSVASVGFGVIDTAAGDMLYGVQAQLVVPVLNACILHVQLRYSAARQHIRSLSAFWCVEMLLIRTGAYEGQAWTRHSLAQLNEN